jgi:drug/metabolite transporter (DMT)-like permease
VTPSLRRGVFWLLVSELCYAVMRVATRAGAADLPWAEIAAARFLGGAVVAVVAARARGVSLRVGDRKNAWLRSIFGTAAAVCLFHALGTRHIAVGDATVLYGTTPLWVALLSGPLLRERVGPLTWGGIGVGFAGVAVLLQAGVEWRSPTALLVLLGAFSYALALLRLRRMSGRESSESIALHLSLVAGAVHLAIALPAMRPVRAAAYLPLAVSAISGGLAQVAVGRAYAHAPAARIAALTYSGVLFTYVFEAVLFHRVPALAQIAGAALVIAGGVLVSGVLRVPESVTAE